MKNRLARVTVALFCAAAAFPVEAAPTFGDKPVTSRAIVRAEVPLSDQQKQYVSEGGNPVSAHAVAVLAVPSGFDPARAWPVLVTLSTSDFKRMNRDDLVNFYRNSAVAEGWVLIAGDGAAPPRNDTVGWRAGMTLAALDALHRSFPSSKNWPVAVAGFSGGAKRAGEIGPLLALAGNRVIGIFLSGVNEDRLSGGYRKFQPGSGFLRTPIYLSSGQQDMIARIAQQQQVKRSMEQTGFTRVRQEIMPHGHAVSRSAIREALRWFRESQSGG